MEKNFITADEYQLTVNTKDAESFLTNKVTGTPKDSIAFMINYSARQTLPYGKWKCKDGTEVIFNREYQPIFKKKDNVRIHADKNEWIKEIIHVTYFYNDVTSPSYFLTKHLGVNSCRPDLHKGSKKSFMICLQVLKDYTPPESTSVNNRYAFTK